MTLAKHIDSKHKGSRFEDLAVAPVNSLHIHPAPGHNSIVPQPMLDRSFSTDHTQYHAHSPAAPSGGVTSDTGVALSPARAIPMSTLTPDLLSSSSSSPSSSSSGSTPLASPLPTPSDNLSVFDQQIASFLDELGWTPELKEALQQSVSLDFSLTASTLPATMSYPCQAPYLGYGQDSLFNDFASYAQQDVLFGPSV